MKVKWIIIWLFIFVVEFLSFADIQAGSFYLGIKKSTETIEMSPLTLALDSAGFELTPDSVQIIVRSDKDDDSMAYIISGTTFPFTAAGIDTSKTAGDTIYIYRQTISTLLPNAANNGNVQYTVGVRFFGHTASDVVMAGFWNIGSGQVLSDSLNTGPTLGEIAHEVVDTSLVRGIDSLLMITTRIALYNGCICDSTRAVYYPLNSKPKDSVQYLCIASGVETLIATLHFTVYSKSVSTSNVVDSSLFEEK